MTRRLAGAAALASLMAVAAVMPAAHADQTYYVPVSRSWTISGHGYGHGHGMSQYGAQGAALQGLDYRRIAHFYYPHTTWSDAKGKVRVLIAADWTSDLQVRARPGLTVRDLADNAVWKLPAHDGIGSWRMTPAKDGSTAVEYHNGSGWHRWAIPGRRGTFKSDGQFHAPGPLTLLLPDGGSVVGKRYRGFLRISRPYPGATSRDTVNVATMDQYVQGVVPYEMPSSWRQQALRAQAVAARTFAAWQRAQNSSRYYQICDTTACQVYGGMAAEAGSSNSAVQATAGQILRYQDKPAFTQFSSSSGGWTAGGGEPYLPAQKDPYDSFDGNSVHSWSVRVGADKLEAQYPEIGRLVDLRVTSRDGNGAWNGRVQQIVLDGTQGKAFVTGDDFRWLLGLRSTWFTIAATPIMVRWRHLGGRTSDLVEPTSGEYAVAGGSAQNFSHGRIYWSAATGAREVQGPSLAAYHGWGGPRSNLGFPVTGMLSAPAKGHKIKLQHGFIFSTTRTGGHVLYGRVLERWGKAGGASSWLGYPTTDVFAIDGGLRAAFQHGVISWDRSTDRYTVVRR
ncbi:MAG: SpoIID/LytB domain-containing protein [Nocardioidaceae bacterium]